MKVFLDTELTGLHQNTTLISIGLVAEDDRYFYAELTDYDKSQVDEWIQENVINNLMFEPASEFECEHNSAVRHANNPVGNDLFVGYSHSLRGASHDVMEALNDWFDQFDEVIIWSDCYALDWVLLCNLFGHAFNMPSSVNYIPRDISTLFEIKGIDPDINREEFSGYLGGYGDDEGQKHNAIWDARVIRACYRKLMSN